MLLKENGGSVAETRAAMLKMRAEGKTQREISEITGYSMSRVSQLTAVHTGKNFKRHSIKGCIYTGLRNWLNENSISQWQLVEMLGFEYTGRTAGRVREIMSGRRDPKKTDIDAFIRISGKKYEELFGEVC